MKSAIACFTADAAHDTTAIYEAAGARDATVIVPPRKTATKSRRIGARDRALLRVKKVGRRQWKKESGYHEQACCPGSGTSVEITVLAEPEGCEADTDDRTRFSELRLPGAPDPLQGRPARQLMAVVDQSLG